MPYDPHRHHRRSIRLRGYDYTQAGGYFVTLCTHERRGLFGAISGSEMVPNDAGQMIERWWCELNRKFPGVRTDAFVVMPDHIHGIIIITAANGANADRVDPDAIDVDNAGCAINANTTVGVDMSIRPRRNDNDCPNDINDAINAGGAFNAGGYADPPLRDDGNDSNAINANPLVGADVHIRPRRTDDESNDADADRVANDMDDPQVRAGASLSTIIQWFKIMTTNEYIRGVKRSGWTPFQKRIWQRNYYERIIRDDESLARVRRYIAGNPARWAEGRDQLDALLARMEWIGGIE